MTATSDLTGIDVEHMLGQTHGPLVKISCQSDCATFVGLVDPTAARQIAAHLTEAAARAEYEADLFHTMRAEGWTDQMAGAVLFMVRAGEAHRHQGGAIDGDDT